MALAILDPGLKEIDLLASLRMVDASIAGKESELGRLECQIDNVESDLACLRAKRFDYVIQLRQLRKRPYTEIVTK